MAYAPIALTMPQYEDYANWYIKAYTQGTTTPLSMATDSGGGTTLAKSEIDANGFPTTDGSARFIPYINGAYDLWMFPTSAEADANDTTNAIQLADNINADPASAITVTTVSYAANISALLAIDGTVESRVNTSGYHTAGDGGGGEFYWDSSQNKANHNGGTIIDPDITFPSDWTNAVQVAAWFTPGVGTGCWVRVYSGQIDIRWFGAKGDAVTDDSKAVQAAIDSAGDTQVGASGDFRDIARNGTTLFVSKGCYLTTTSLTIPNNIHIVGTGDGSQFRFDPASATTDFMVNRRYTGGGALSRSSISLRFEKFYVYVAPDGGTVVGRNGSDLATVNSNSRHCFHIIDGMNVSFHHVKVTDFHYGTAFRLRLDALFAFYNELVHCYGRDNMVMVEPSSATEITNCHFGHGPRFPEAARMSLHLYAIDLDGTRGCSIHGGSVECYAATALINDNGTGHSITGLYTEGFTETPSQINVTMPSDAASVFHGGNSYGFSQSRNIPVLVARTGSSGMNYGMNLNFGDYEELELYHSTTRQSPSFRYGLPGSAHFPAGGTLAISSTSFIDRTSIELTRGAGTAATDNQCSYNFKLRDGQQVVANVYITMLVKFEGGEDDVTIRTTAPSNANLKKVLAYDNGWELWAIYTTPAADQTFTILVTQNAGSVDTARKVRFTALRAYTNGFAPIPAAYKGIEYRDAAPTAGDWLQGDLVFNSQPAAGGEPGWMCVTSGSPGTWKAMANLAA